MWKTKVLLISDPNLGPAAHDRLAQVCEDLTWYCWDINGDRASSTILTAISAKRWDVAVSFYSDLILPAACLEAIALPLNIHPALPHIRGVAHDVLPLVENHPAIGATLHHMDCAVDTGRIYDVLEVPLPPGQTYQSIRALNQAASLRMLDRLCGMLVGAVELAALQASLLAQASPTRREWGPYYSRKMVAELKARHELEEVRQRERPLSSAVVNGQQRA